MRKSNRNLLFDINLHFNKLSMMNYFNLYQIKIKSEFILYLQTRS